MQASVPAWCTHIWDVTQPHVEDPSAELNVSVGQECCGLALNTIGHLSQSLQALAVVHRAGGACPGLHLAVWAGD